MLKLLGSHWKGCKNVENSLPVPRSPLETNDAVVMPAFKQNANHFTNEKQCLIRKTYIHFQVDQSGN